MFLRYDNMCVTLLTELDDGRYVNVPAIVRDDDRCVIFPATERDVDRYVKFFCNGQDDNRYVTFLQLVETTIGT